MSTSKFQYLAPFLKIYKEMKIIMSKKLYPKLGILMESLTTKKLSFTNAKWWQLFQNIIKTKTKKNIVYWNPTIELKEMKIQNNDLNDDIINDNVIN
jgi:hypothetical protein